MGFLSKLAGGGIFDAVGAYGAAKAGKKQSKAIINDYSGVEQKATGAYNPYMQEGQNAIAQAGQMMTPGFQFNPADPSVAYRTHNVMDEIQRSAAANGTLHSGGTLKALNQNIQDVNNTYYQNDLGNRFKAAEFGLNATNNYTNALFNAARGRALARGMRADAIGAQWGAGTDIAKSVVGAAMPGGGGFSGFTGF